MRKKSNRRSSYYVYILQCNDGTYYTGYTNDLERRIELHNKGKGAKYVRGRCPVKLVYYRGCRTRKYVMKEERRIKKLTRRQKEEIMKCFTTVRLGNPPYNDGMYSVGFAR